MGSSPSSSPSASVSVTPSASLSQELGDEQVVTVAEAKAQLNITHSDDDELIDAYIDAATSWAQSYQGRKYLNETCIDYLDDWPADVIRPRWSNLVSVTSITYIDTAGVQQTWSSAQYDVDADAVPGRICPGYGYSWPTFRGDQAGIVVTYVAGYGATKDSAPAHVRQALLLLVGHWYANREAVSDLNLTQIPFGVRALLGMDRVIRV